jgi:hypothetical protein
MTNLQLAAFLSCPSLKRFQTLHTLRITEQFLTLNTSNYAPRSRDGRRTRRRCVTHRFDLTPLISQLCIVGGGGDYPMTTVEQPLQDKSNFGDSSWPLFSIYSDAAKHEDKEMVERWQKDAEGIVIFVSPRIGIHTSSHINWNALDRSILCRSCCAPCCDRPGPKTRHSGYLRILPWKHLSGSRRPERNTFIYSFPYSQTTSILSSEICCLGELPLVPELGHGPQLCFVGHIVTTMGTSISPSGSSCPVQSRKASANACILCQGHGQGAYFVGS